MVNKKKKSSAKNIKYNKSKVQKIKQNVTINLTAPKTRARSSRASQPRPPPPMPNIVSTFTPIMPPPPPPSAPMALPQQFMSANSMNPFASMMASQQQQQQASQVRAQGNGLERTPEPEQPTPSAPSEPAGETAEEKRRRILGRDLPPNPFARASEPVANPLKGQKMETKPAVVAQPSFGDELLNAVKNPKLKKRRPKEEDIVEKPFEEALKSAKLKPTKPAEEMPPLAEDVPEVNALGQNIPPKPQEVFESPESQNVLVLKQPAKRTLNNGMTMLELREQNEQREGRRIVPIIELPPLRNIRDDTPPQPPSDIAIYKPRISREEMRNRWIQKFEKPVIQAPTEENILEPPKEKMAEEATVLPKTPPKDKKKEAYEEDAGGQAESYKSPETLAEEARREKYIRSLQRTKNPDLISMMEQEKLQHQRTYKIESGKWVNKKMTKEEMVNALKDRYDEKKANEKRLLAQPKTRSRGGVK